MPIRPEERDRYPANWTTEIRPAILERARNRCEGSPAFPKCRARNREPHPETGSPVVLTIAHLDQTPENCDPENLRAWCQRCHLTYDARQHALTRARRRETDVGQARLFEYEDGPGAPRLVGPSTKACVGQPCPSCGVTMDPEVGCYRCPEAHARRTDPETSHAAAASLSPGKLRESQKAVLGLFERAGRAMTDPDVAELAKREWVAISPSGLRTRRSELVTAGLLEDSGERATLASGRKAIMWRLARR